MGLQVLTLALLSGTMFIGLCVVPTKVFLMFSTSFGSWFDCANAGNAEAIIRLKITAVIVLDKLLYDIQVLFWLLLRIICKSWCAIRICGTKYHTF